MLEAIRILGLDDTPLLSGVHLLSSTERRKRSHRRDHALLPAVPYGAAKLYAYWITVNYRESYGSSPRTVFWSTM